MVGTQFHVVHRAHEAIDRAVVDLNPLGDARGAGGVGDVREMMRVHLHRGRRVALLPQGGPLGCLVEHDDGLALARREKLSQATVCQHCGCFGVVQHEAQALARIEGFEGEVGAPGPQDSDRATIVSSERSRNTPTGRSGPTPSRARRCAS